MRKELVRFSPAALAFVGGFAVCSALAQAPAKRDFDAEAQAAVQSAKTAAGFEFLGTLARVCLLPQSGGEDSSDVLPAYIANPASAPARDTWYAEPARVFDNLYFESSPPLWGRRDRKSTRLNSSHL